MPYIYGRHPVMDALKHGDDIQKIYVQHGLQGEKIKRVQRAARQRKVNIVTADPRKLKQMAGNGNHQGIVALISPVKILPFETFLTTFSSEQDCQTLVVLDRIQDPHNMGAIIRSAEIFGAAGLLFSERDNVPVTDTVVKASAGAAMHCPIYKADNLGKAINRLQEAGMWLFGAALNDDAKPIWKIDFNRHCGIIIGNEEKGLRPLLQKKCDDLFYIPQVGKTQSLNASVAAGIALSEMTRQRQSEFISA